MSGPCERGLEQYCEEGNTQTYNAVERDGTSSNRKREDAKRLGVHEYVVSSDAAQMAKIKSRLDLIINTVSAVHDIGSLLLTLRLDATMVLVGAPGAPLALPAFPLLMNRRAIAGSGIGGISETQEMLDFCAAHRVTADVEVVSVKQINEAYDRLAKADVRYRFVIDNATLG